MICTPKVRHFWGAYQWCTAFIIGKLFHKTLTCEQFDVWKDEATVKRQDVEFGILDMNEYATWLKNNMNIV